jgi:trehalose 6-phosphate phosphatase
VTTSSPVPPIASDTALFLDFDGTLVPFEDDPLNVRVDAALGAVVQAWSARLAGALALVSGRPIEQVDRCFAPARLPVAGLHGLERRAADGELHRAAAAAELRRVAQFLRSELAGEAVVKLEDKGLVLTIHFRAAPERAEAMHSLARSVLDQLGSGYRLLAGANVVELLPLGVNKGTAVRDFMAEAPFAGRRPVFIGDDVTDLDGFAAAKALGGYGIAVGTRVAADYRLTDVQAVRDWLRTARWGVHHES